MKHMHKPPHPGVIVNEMYLVPLEMTITQMAQVLDVSRQTLSDLVNGKRNISVEMAMRLAKAFETTPERWLNLQMQYDIWILRKKKFPKIKSIINKAVPAS